MKNPGILPDGTYALGYPDYVNRAVFSTAGSTARGIPVPTSLGSHIGFFSADCNFTVRYNSTVGAGNAVYGASAASSGEAHELNPTVRCWPKGSIGELSVISPTSGIVTVSFYNPGST